MKDTSDRGAGESRVATPAIRSLLMMSRRAPSITRESLDVSSIDLSSGSLACAQHADPSPITAVSRLQRAVLINCTKLDTAGSAHTGRKRIRINPTANPRLVPPSLNGWPGPHVGSPMPTLTMQQGERHRVQSVLAPRVGCRLTVSVAAHASAATYSYNSLLLSLRSLTSETLYLFSLAPKTGHL